MANKYNPQLLGKKIRRIRKLKKLSIVEFSKLTGVNKNTICKIERGNNNISVGTIFKISDALDISLYDLLEDKLIENIDYNLGIRMKNHETYITAKRGKRANICDLPNYSLGDLDIHLPGSVTIAGIVEVFPEGRKEVAYHDGEELFFCLTGKIKIQINNDEIVLNKGDALHFWGQDAHTYSSVREDGNKMSVGLTVLINSGHTNLKEFHENLNIIDKRDISKI